MFYKYTDIYIYTCAYKIFTSLVSNELMIRVKFLCSNIYNLYLFKIFLIQV